VKATGLAPVTGAVRPLIVSTALSFPMRESAFCAASTNLNTSDSDAAAADAPPANIKTPARPTSQAADFFLIEPKKLITPP